MSASQVTDEASAAFLARHEERMRRVDLAISRVRQTARTPGRFVGRAGGRTRRASKTR
jgi:hypothetical protein